MQQSKTARRIQKAAEALFAEQGFAETTMRQITSAAEVNLASVNYHFGSKQGLIQAVAEKYLEPFVVQVSHAAKAYAEVHPGHAANLDDLIEILMRTLLAVHQDNTHALSMFTRLLDLAYMKNQAVLRDYLIERFKPEMNGFLTLLRTDAAPMEDDEFFWRLHFLLGSMVFTLSNYHTLIAIEAREFEQTAQIEKILHRMVPVISAGFQARAETTYFSRL